MHDLQFKLPDGGTLRVVSDDLYGLESTDNVNSYDAIHHVPSRAGRSYVAKRGVVLTSPDGTTRNSLLVFPSGSSLQATNVLLHDRQLFVASGVALAAVDLSTLTISWAIDLQSGADKGLHIVNEGLLLAIGDYDATLLTLDGTIRWVTDIPGCLVRPGLIDNGVLIIDDDDLQTHKLDLATGKLLAR